MQHIFNFSKKYACVFLSYLLLMKILYNLFVYTV